MKFRYSICILIILLTIVMACRMPENGSDFFNQNQIYSIKDQIVKSAKVIVSLLDAVANQVNGEVWTTSVKKINPYNLSYFCFESKLDSYFTLLNDTYIYQIAGGANVVPVVGFKYHAFYFNQKGENLNFKWVNRDHFEIGREWHDDTVRSQLGWLAERLK